MGRNYSGFMNALLSHGQFFDSALPPSLTPYMLISFYHTNVFNLEQRTGPMYCPSPCFLLARFAIWNCRACESFDQLAWVVYLFFPLRALLVVAKIVDVFLSYLFLALHTGLYVLVWLLCLWILFMSIPKKSSSVLAVKTKLHVKFKLWCFNLLFYDKVR